MNNDLNETYDFSSTKNILSVGVTFFKNAKAIAGQILNVITYIVNSLIAPLYGGFDKVNSAFEARQKELNSQIDSNIKEAGVADEVAVLTFLNNPGLTVLDAVNKENLNKLPGVMAIGGLANAIANLSLSKLGRIQINNETDRVSFRRYSLDVDTESVQLTPEGNDNLTKWLVNVQKNNPEMLPFFRQIINNPESKEAIKFNKAMNSGDESAIDAMFSKFNKKNKPKSRESLQAGRLLLKDLLFEEAEDKSGGKKIIDLYKEFLKIVSENIDSSKAENATIEKINKFKEIQNQVRSKLNNEKDLLVYIKVLNGLEEELFRQVDNLYKDSKYKLELKNKENIKKFIDSSTKNDDLKNLLNNIEKVDDSFKKINDLDSEDDKKVVYLKKLNAIIGLLNEIQSRNIREKIKKSVSSIKKNSTPDYIALIENSDELKSLDSEVLKMQQETSSFKEKDIASLIDQINKKLKDVEKKKQAEEAMEKDTLSVKKQEQSLFFDLTNIEILKESYKYNLKDLL
jgi:hypothetical protein